MTLEEARSATMSAWPHHSHIARPENVLLFDRFSEILMRHVNQEVSAYQIREARKILHDHLRDPGLRIAYTSNIAMLLNDRYGIKDHDERNAAAEDILNLLFS